jgi:hypothetical protein
MGSSLQQARKSVNIPKENGAGLTTSVGVLGEPDTPQLPEARFRTEGPSREGKPWRTPGTRNSCTQRCSACPRTPAGVPSPEQLSRPGPGEPRGAFPPQSWLPRGPPLSCRGRPVHRTGLTRLKSGPEHWLPSTRLPDGRRSLAGTVCATGCQRLFCHALLPRGKDVAPLLGETNCLLLSTRDAIALLRCHRCSPLAAALRTFTALCIAKRRGGVKKRTAMLPPAASF